MLNHMSLQHVTKYLHHYAAACQHEQVAVLFDRLNEFVRPDKYMQF